MPDTSHPFAHRTNPDGTIDSICKACYATVGTAERPMYLRAVEDAHICDEWRLMVINAPKIKMPN